jgi:peroxiredoxin
MDEKLNAGDQFPPLTLQVGDGTLQLPEIKDSGYSLILFYRGHW